jgi:hypothetical protein
VRDIWQRRVSGGGVGQTGSNMKEVPTGRALRGRLGCMTDGYNLILSVIR